MSLSYAFRIAPSTFSGIIRETCLAIYDKLKLHYLSIPTKEGFKKIAEDFEELWDMPHRASSLDGKHIFIQVHITISVVTNISINLI